MKIGFQGYFLTKPHTGIGQYSLHLLNSMAKTSKKCEFIVAVPEKIDLKFPKNVTVKVISPRGGISSTNSKSGVLYEQCPRACLSGRQGQISSLQKVYWEQIQVPSFFKKQNVDLVHFPYPASPWYRSPFKGVVTVHDTIPWDRKDYVKSLMARFKQKQSKKALKRASKIITVSKATAKDLARHIPSSKKKTEVIYNAPAPIFLKKIDTNRSKRILQNYKLKAKSYFLYVGGFDERKNVHILAETFLKDIAPKYAVDLVFVGDKLHVSELYKSLDYLTNLTESTSVGALKGKIKLTGFVSDEDLCALYSGALAFLNLSLQEGFNIPLVEAACAQIPVLTSDIPVHREILGDYAIFSDPKSSKDLAKNLQKLLKKPLIKKYICPYNWDLSAKETLKIYEHLLTDNHTG